MAIKSRIVSRNGETVQVNSDGEYFALKQQGWVDATPTSGGDFDNEAAGGDLSAYASKAGDNVFAGNNVFTGSQFSLFGSGAGPRIPFSANPVVDAATALNASTTNIVGLTFSPEIKGNWAGMTGSDPGHWWGQNLFARVAATARGITSPTGALIELAILQDGGTITTARGLETGVSLYGNTAGATITQAESLRVSAPAKKVGSPGGSMTNVYGIFVEAVTAGGVGATGSVFSLYVDGGVSRFKGRVDVTDTIANSGASDLQLYAGFAQADGGHLQLMKAAAGGHARFRIATANSEFQVFDGTAVTFAVTRAGLPKWTAAANAQTTVGAAGAASALPATPTKYLKVVDSAGTTYVIPAYAAA